MSSFLKLTCTMCHHPLDIPKTIFELLQCHNVRALDLLNLIQLAEQHAYRTA